LADAKLQETLKGFVLLHIDLTDPGKGSPASAAAQSYKVEYLPDLRILSADGTVKSTVEARDAEGLARELKAALGK
jgi:hypothetical protein